MEEAANHSIHSTFIPQNKESKLSFYFASFREIHFMEWSEIKSIITVQLLEQEYTCCLQ